MVRFQRQPPGTAITRASLILGGAFTAAGVWLIVDGRERAGGLAAAAAAALLLAGGHRANHGAGGPLDRMLTELLDRSWDGATLGAIIWRWVSIEPAIALAAIVALCGSFLSSYVRARGAALGYSVEESHVTRGLRYGLISLGLVTGALAWAIWTAATVSVIATLVRTSQVAREERAA